MLRFVVLVIAFNCWCSASWAQIETSSYFKEHIHESLVHRFLGPRRNMPILLRENPTLKVMLPYTFSMESYDGFEFIFIEFKIRITLANRYENVPVGLLGKIRLVPGTADFYILDSRLSKFSQQRIAQSFDPETAEIIENFLKNYFGPTQEDRLGFDLNQKVLAYEQKIPDSNQTVFQYIFTSFDSWAKTEDARRRQLTYLFHSNDYPDLPEESIQHVLRIEENLGEPLPDKEAIRAGVSHYVNMATNNGVNDGCFTCTMEVLTAQGYRRIDSLKEGDEVLSWDESLEKLVPNKILKIHASENATFGELIDHSKPGKPFEVAPDLAFLLPENKTSESIVKVDADQKLLSISPSAEGCETMLVPKGNFEYKGIAPAKALVLEHEPNNFIVHGLVVQIKSSSK